MTSETIPRKQPRSRKERHTLFDEKTQSSVSFEIEDYVRGISYRMKVKSPLDTYTVQYKTRKVAEGLEVIFYQEAGFETSTQTTLRLFSEAVYYGRMSDALFGQKGISRAEMKTY